MFRYYVFSVKKISTILPTINFFISSTALYLQIKYINKMNHPKKII